MKYIDFAWCEVMAVTKSEVWEKLCLQLVHSFHGFEKVDEEFKEVFSNLVIFSEKLALDLKKDKFLGLLVMQPEELVAQRKDEETRGRSNQKTKRFTMQEMARGCSLFEEAPLHFEPQNLNNTQSLQQPLKMQSSATVSSIMRKKRERERATSQTSLDYSFKG